MAATFFKVKDMITEKVGMKKKFYSKVSFKKYFLFGGGVVLWL
jgi:hypothetical protein